MSGGYKYITWTRYKYAYDIVLLAGVALYIVLFTKIAPQFWQGPSINGLVIQIRAYGTCAFLMLTMILCIGPLARLDKRFLPLLYNRRHFGVVTCFVALYHVKLVLDWYHNYAELAPIVSLFVSITENLNSFSGFSFELLGLLALIILCLMAVTSHDFWLHFLSAPVWKTLHMAVYAAYVLLVMHIALGALQSEQSFFFIVLLSISLVMVISLHLITGLAEWQQDRQQALLAQGLTKSDEPEWMDAGLASDIADKRAKIVTLQNGERVAIFRYDNKISALSNVCAHQNGPLGEGRIIGGCVTCPWHGFQYQPHNGTSPPPFDEKVPTYRLKLDGERLWLHTQALPAGTAVEPVLLGDAHV